MTGIIHDVISSTLPESVLRENSFLQFGAEYLASHNTGPFIYESDLERLVIAEKPEYEELNHRYALKKHVTFWASSKWDEQVRNSFINVPWVSINNSYIESDYWKYIRFKSFEQFVKTLLAYYQSCWVVDRPDRRGLSLFIDNVKNQTKFRKHLFPQLPNDYMYFVTVCGNGKKKWPLLGTNSGYGNKVLQALRENVPPYISFDVVEIIATLCVGKLDGGLSQFLSDIY